MPFEMDCGLTFFQFFDMSDEEKATFEKDHPFHYANIDEYIADVKRWLTLSSWHYSEEAASKLIESERSLIEDYFAKRAPVDLAGADIGYCCG